MQVELFQDLVAGIDPAWLCAFLQIHLRTLKRWKSGTAPVPFCALLALKLKLNGDVAGFFGEGWKDFYFGRDGKFYIPGFRGGFDPWQMQGTFFELQELHSLRVEVEKLRADLATANLSVWASQKVQSLLSQS